MELEDLQVFLPEEQAREALDAFDCDADGHISSDDMKDAVLQVGALSQLHLYQLWADIWMVVQIVVSCVSNMPCMQLRRVLALL